MAGDSPNSIEHAASPERVRYFLVGFRIARGRQADFGRGFQSCTGPITDITIKAWESDISHHNAGDRVLIMFTSEIEKFDDTQP